MYRWFYGSFDVFLCLIFFTGIQVLHHSYIPGIYNIQGRSSTELFIHLFWIWTIQTRGTASVHKRCDIPHKKFGDSTREELQQIGSSLAFKHLSESKLQLLIISVRSTIWPSWVLSWYHQISSDLSYPDLLFSLLLLIYLFWCWFAKFWLCFFAPILFWTHVGNCACAVSKKRCHRLCIVSKKRCAHLRVVSRKWCLLRTSPSTTFYKLCHVGFL